jgi:hypothetical protein
MALCFVCPHFTLCYFGQKCFHFEIIYWNWVAKQIVNVEANMMNVVGLLFTWVRKASYDANESIVSESVI